MADVSVVLADGQTSGRGAKAVSMMVVRKVIGLLAEGVRDGAAARAASDALYTDKSAKVSCTLNIASIDLETNTVVLSRNNPAPIFICHDDQIDCYGYRKFAAWDSQRYPPGYHRSGNRAWADHRHVYRRPDTRREAPRPTNGCVQCHPGHAG